MRVLQLLVLAAADDPLAEEVRDALGRVRGLRGLVHVESERRRGLEWARDRRPEVVVVSADAGAEGLRETGEALLEASPESLVVAAYRPEQLSGPEELIPALRASVRDFLRRPVSSIELEQVLRRLLASSGETVPRGRVISFVSNKGGVGKSTLATSTACLLASRHPGRVLLVDASLQLGVCASLLDLAPETTLTDAARERDRLDESLLRTISVQHECGLRLLAAPVDALDAAEVGEAAIGRILTVARRSFDYVIVDTFPMIDSVALAILDLSDRVEVVINGLVPHVLGGAAFLGVLERLGLPEDRQRLVLNNTHPAFAGSLRASDVATRLDRTLDHVVPFSRRALASVNSGKPPVLGLKRFGRFGRAVREIVEDLESLRGDAPDTHVEVDAELEHDDVVIEPEGGGRARGEGLERRPPGTLGGPEVSS